MPVSPTYPGVYVEEVPSGVRTITGVATSITAFVGVAARGPIDEAETLTSYADFERKFGGLTTLSKMPYAVRDFFLNGGTTAIVVRVFREFALDGAAATRITGVLTGIKTKIAAAASVDAARDVARTEANAELKKRASAEVVKAFTDLILESSETDPVKLKALATTLKDAAKTLPPAGAAPAGKGAAVQAVTAARDVLDPTKKKSPAYRLASVMLEQASGAIGDATKSGANVFEIAKATADALEAAHKTIDAVAAAGVDGIIAIRKGAKAEATKAADAATVKALSEIDTLRRVVAEAEKVVKDDTQAIIGDRAFKAGQADLTNRTTATLSDRGLKLKAANKGSWANALRARVDHNVREDGGDDPKKLFNLSVSDGVLLERFANVSIDTKSPRRVDKVLEQESKLVRWQTDLTDNLPAGDRPEAHDTPPAGQNPFADYPPDVRYNTKPDTKAADGTPIKFTDGAPIEAGDVTGSPSASTGMYALQRVDLFNLLCIPPYTRGDGVDQNVLSDAAAFCERKRAMLLVDSPVEWNDAQKAVDAINANTFPNLPSKNAVLFFPRIKMPDPLNGNRIDPFAPCGAIAGIFSRTDATRGVWKAPAGLEAGLLGVSDLSVKLTDAQNGLLNPIAVNCLRTFPVVGSVVWGARTLRGADRLADADNRYVPVRRLTLFIEESLYRGTQFAVFEPNGATLWGQLRLAVGAFMQNLFNQGAFAGKTASEAFFVKCDNTTTTQIEIDLGKVVVDIGFAPLKPAEFVILRIQQMAGQSTT